jgi:deoxyribose-phosphate aldolase
MYIDFAIIDTDINDTQAKDIIKYVIDNNCVNSITIPYYFSKLIKSYINNNGCDFSCFIDYPLGISDSKTRVFAVDQAIKSGFNTIDVCVPQNLATNRKYDKIREDINSIVEITKNKNVNIRYISEYRKFDHFCLKKICEIFENLGIKYVFPSTSYFLDNLADNILASVFLYNNSKDLKIICTGNVWTDNHFDTMIKSGLFGFRTTSIHALNNFIKFNLTKQKK